MKNIELKGVGGPNHKLLFISILNLRTVENKLSRSSSSPISHSFIFPRTLSNLNLLIIEINREF